MKQLTILCTFAFLFILHASAQQDTAAATDTAGPVIQPPVPGAAVSSRLPVKGDIGFTFNLIGFIDTISIGSFKDYIGNDFFLARYYFSEKTAFRMGMGFNLFNEKWSLVDSIGASQVARDSSFKRTDFYLTPGIEKHFASGKNLDPYLASSISVGKIGRTKIRDMVTTTDTTGKTTSDYTFEMDGGYLIGLNIIAGFNYFFSEKFSIGAEYGLGVNSSRLGGDWNEVLIDTPPSGSPTVKRQVGSFSINSTKVKMNSAAGIMVSYFF